MGVTFCGVSRREIANSVYILEKQGCEKMIRCLNELQ